MHFLSQLFASIAAFFGFGAAAPAEPAPQPPAPIVREATDTVPVFPIATATSVSDSVALLSDTTNVEPDTTDHDTPTESESLTRDEADSLDAPVVPWVDQDIRTMLVAGGCFWCVESDLEKVHGVLSVVSGYSGGTTQDPTYQNYAAGGHREVVEVTYDANQVSFEDILIVTMKTTDPTDDDGTFHDRGDQYSSAFYYENDKQKQVIDSLIAEVDEHGPYENPLAIDVEQRSVFWPAEDYHQDYYKGTLSQLKYKYYRNASGRDDFIIKYWGVNDHSADLPWRHQSISLNQSNYMWSEYKKPNEDVLKSELSDLAFDVTQEEGTERAGSSPLDKNYEPGIYVDILSGEPLYSSKDKFDSGTGWPSFVRPITQGAVTEHEDKKLFTTRTEIRSTIADNHLGHVFTDGPKESTGLRYCMNGVALRFVPKDKMQEEGYGDFLQYVE